MKNIRKLTTRSILGLISISLVVTSGFALFLFSQTIPTFSVNNPSGLNSLCASPLIAGTTTNNGTSGNKEQFVTSYSCTSPITTPNSPTATAQGVLSVVTAATYFPTFNIDTSASTATIVSVSVQLGFQSISGGASFCNVNVPLFALSSGVGQALATVYVCQNGSTNSNTNVDFYTVTVVASTFGTISVAPITITWKSS